MRIKPGDISFTTTLPKELGKLLKAEARSRRVQQKQIAISALTSFLSPPEKSEDVLLRRLSRIEGRQQAIDDKLEILSETVALFIQVWFSNTFELPENEKATASSQGEKRFNKFIEALNRRLSADGEGEQLDVSTKRE